MWNIKNHIYLNTGSLILGDLPVLGLKLFSIGKVNVMDSLLSLYISSGNI